MFLFFSSYFGSNPNKLLCFKPPVTPYTIKPHYNSTVRVLGDSEKYRQHFSTDVFSIYVMSIDRMCMQPYTRTLHYPFYRWTRVLRTKLSGCGFKRDRESRHSDAVGVMRFNPVKSSPVSRRGNIKKKKKKKN